MAEQELLSKLDALSNGRLITPLIVDYDRAVFNNWTDFEVSTLRTMWDEGASGSKIGAKLGKSRSAVLRKARTLNLPARVPSKLHAGGRG